MGDLTHSEVEASGQNALSCWRYLCTNASRNIAVEAVQPKTERRVFKLVSAADDGRNIIAKRAPLKFAILERNIYQVILPMLPNRLDFYGFVRDGAHAWIFIEESLGRRYDPGSQSDRELAGEWLAVLHTSTCQIRPGNLVPTSINRVATDLQQSKALLAESESNKQIDARSREVLRSLLTNLRIIAKRWDALVKWCDLAPQTLTHGDFKINNVKISRTLAGSNVLDFYDWHQASWGAPVLDQARFLGYPISPDVEAYCNTAGKCWPSVNVDQVHHWGFVGETFRCITAIRWAAEHLHHGKVPRALANLKLYEPWMAEVVEAQPWRRHPQSRVARRITPRGWA